MNLKNFLKVLLMLAVFTVMVNISVFAQPYSTVYVDVTNGSDAYTGQNAANSPAGQGPKATIGGGLSVLANGGTLVLVAGPYNGVDNAAGDININTGTYPGLINFTIQLTPLQTPASLNVNLTAGNFILNNGGTVNIVSTGGAVLNFTGAVQNITLTSGNLNLDAASSWVLNNATSTLITLNGTARFTNAAPTKNTVVSLLYQGGAASSTYTAGPESNYGNYGLGTITVNRTATSTVILPYAITFAGNTGTVINVQNGNATFSSAVNLGVGDVANANTGTVTFSQTLGLGVTGPGPAAATNISQIINTTSGSIVVVGTSTWTGDANANGQDFYASGFPAIDNQNANGTVQLGPINLVANNAAGDFYSLHANNVGTMTLGAVTANSSGTNTNYGNFALVNTGTATINGGTYRYAGGLPALSNTLTLNITGNTTLPGGVFNNNGTTNLGANKLTLTGAVNHTTFGGTVSGTGEIYVNNATATTAQFNGGTLGNVEVNSAGTGAVTFMANLNTVSTLLGTSGTININNGLNAVNVTVVGSTINANSAVTVSGNTLLNGGSITVAPFTYTTTNFTQSAGTFTLVGGASVLDVKGNLARTSGTFLANPGSLVSFTGTTTQSINGGALFQVDQLMFNNAVSTLTVGNSIRATGNVTIATATTINFGTTNLILNGAAGNGITNNGTYTASGGGGVILGGSTTVVGGVASNGFTMQGTGVYSYVTVDVGALNTAQIIATLTGVKWSGVLTLKTGTLDVATAGVDFSPYGNSASIVRYPETSPGITTSAGTFNNANVAYDLIYTGAITANHNVGTELMVNPQFVKSWTVQTTGAFNNVLTGALNFGGTLYIANGATVDNAGFNFTLAGTGLTHTVKGTILGAGQLIVTGAIVNINGGATTDAATISNIQISSTTGCTIAGINSFSGTFTTNAGSIATLGMNTTAATQKILGAVTLGGSSFTITTNIEAQAGVTHNAGSVNFGNNNLQLTTGGNFLQTAGSYSSTGGYLVFSVAGNLTLTSAMPYLRANNVVITLLSNITVSQNLDVTGAGTPAIAGVTFNCTIQNGMTTVGGNIFTGTGALILAGTTVTASGDPTISNLTVNSTGTANLASNNTTVRNFIVPGVLTMTAGNLSIGSNNISLTGAGGVFVYTAGLFQAGTGELQFNGGAAQSANQGTGGFSVPNLTINDAAGVTFLGGAGNDWTVTGNLKLTSGQLKTSTTTSKLRIADGVWIIRIADASSLDKAPTFDGTVNLNYPNYTVVVSPSAMGLEVPTAASNKLNNIIINVGVGNVLQTGAATQFSGTATLTSGNWDNAGGAITVGTGGTVVMQGGLLNQAPTVTTYNLTYTTGFVGPLTGVEFISPVPPATANVTNLSILGNAAIRLSANESVINLIINSTGANSVDLNGKTLTLTGNMTYTAGTVVANNGSLTFAGVTGESIILPVTGIALDNLTLNLSGVNPVLNVTGGNITINNTTGLLVFVNGILNMGTNTLVLPRPQVAANSGLGFDRSGVTGANVGVVVGTVSRNAATGDGGVGSNGRFEFPTGNLAGQYRPAAITFTPSYPVGNPTNITVKSVDSAAGGVRDLPLDGGGVTIGNYPNFYWLITTNPASLTSTQNFDIELTAHNIGYPYNSYNDLRMIRRQDGSSQQNGWQLQGFAPNYSNYQVVNGTDTTVTVRTTSSQGGLITAGSRFTMGVPSRAPLFTAPVVTNYSQNEATTLTVQFTATAQDVGTTITGYALNAGAPSWASLNPTTGLLTLTPTYGNGSNTPFTFTVTATSSNGLTTPLAIMDTVHIVDRPPVFTQVLPNSSIKNDSLFTFTYKATDPDAGQTLTFSLVSVTPTATVAPAITGAGVFTWTPSFTDLSKVFTVVVKVSDGTLSVNDTASVTIKFARKMGDVAGNGGPDPASASLVLQYSVGAITLTAQQLYAANVDGNGSVNAYDAANILYAYAHHDTTISGSVLMKTSARGTIAFGKLSSEPNSNTVILPISLNNTANVYSAYVELNIDKQYADIANVAGTLPQGWVMSHFYSDGVLKIAMAGTTPLSDGNIADISLNLKDKETHFTVTGSAELNANYNAELGNLTVQQIPNQFELSQNYPNPFNPTTTIKYQLAQNSKVTLEIYDMLGQRIRTLVNDVQDAGYYTISWDGSNNFGQQVSSGIYIYRLQAGSFVKTLKMNLLK